jgi:hypothetical protein
VQRKYFVKFAVHYLKINLKKQNEMKKILLSLALVAGFGFANAQNTPEADASVQVESTNVTIDFVLQTGLIP